MKVFEIIKQLADNQGKSLQKVAEDLGLSTNYIYQLKVAKSPAADKLALIADYFNVSVDYLLGRTEFKNSAELMGAIPTSIETGSTVDEISKLMNLNDSDKLLLQKGMTLDYLSKKLKDSNLSYSNNNPNFHLAVWLEIIVELFKRYETDIEDLEKVNGVISGLISLAFPGSLKEEEKFYKLLGKNSSAYVKIYNHLKDKKFI